MKIWYDSTLNRQVYILKIETTAFTGMELECEKDAISIGICSYSVISNDVRSC